MRLTLAIISMLAMMKVLKARIMTLPLSETSGAVNEEGLQVIKQLLRCAMGHSAYVSRAWARLSCVIQASVAQMILHREGDDSIGVGVGVVV